MILEQPSDGNPEVMEALERIEGILDRIDEHVGRAHDAVHAITADADGEPPASTRGLPQLWSPVYEENQP